jgi:hypothetical protein
MIERSIEFNTIMEKTLQDTLSQSNISCLLQIKPPPSFPKFLLKEER